MRLHINSPPHYKPVLQIAVPRFVIEYNEDEYNNGNMLIGVIREKIIQQLQEQLQEQLQQLQEQLPDILNSQNMRIIRSGQAFSDNETLNVANIVDESSVDISITFADGANGGGAQGGGRHRPHRKTKRRKRRKRRKRKTKRRRR